MRNASGQAQESHATLLLRGGHRCLCKLDSEGAALRALQAALQPGSAVSIPITLETPAGGQIIVRPQDLVAVIMGDEQAALPSAGYQSALAAPRIRANADLPGTPFFVVDQFLSADEETRVLDFALSKQETFAQATVTTTAVDYRRSHVLYNIPDLLPVFMPKLQALVPTAWPLLKMAPVLIANFECQLTAHGDGDYFKVHNDNGSPDTSRRVVSYVYYFNRQPKGFTGGQLRIFDTTVENFTYGRGTEFRDLEPAHNSLVIFPSYCHHEVLPIASPSGKFEDRRFTVNGWFVRA